MNLRRIRPLLLAAPLLVAVAAPAAATMTYTDVGGPNFSWTSIQESSTFGDPEPLFGQPLGGDNLLFFPANFAASSAGGGVDQTGSQLQAMLEAVGTSTIDGLLIQEFGDTTLAGAGTAATGTFAGIGGFATVLEVNGLPVAPMVIPFSDAVWNPTDTFTLTANPGVTQWSGTMFLDISAWAPGATKLQLSYDNNLFAFSEPTTSSSIQKKVVNGPSIVVTPVPEPGTFALLGAGLLAAFAGGRRR